MEDSNENTARLPQSITLGGIVYNVSDTPELKVFIQQVSSVEKQKHYSNIESFKKQLSELKAVQVSSDTLDINTLADAVVAKMGGTFVTKEDMAESVTNAVASTVKPLLSDLQARQVNEIEEYKNQLLKENDGKCIPELVSGNTKEELQESLRKSVELFSKYRPVEHAPQTVSDPLVQQQIREQLPQMEPITTESPKPQPVQVPSIPRVEPMQVNDNRPSVKNMPMSEFAAKRDSLFAQIQSEYSN